MAVPCVRLQPCNLEPELSTIILYNRAYIFISTFSFLECVALSAGYRSTIDMFSSLPARLSFCGEYFR